MLFGNFMGGEAAFEHLVDVQRVEGVGVLAFEGAFHQPGVQAYKLASKGVIKLLTDSETILAELAPISGTASEIAAKTNLSAQEYELEGILTKLSANTEKRENAVKVSRAWNPDKGWVYTIAK